MKKKLAKRSATCFYIVHLHVGVKGQTRKIRKQEKITNEMLFFFVFFLRAYDYRDAIVCFLPAVRVQSTLI